MPRRFGQEISPNIRRRPHLTPEQRGKIVGAHEAGFSYRQITRQYGVAKSTICDTINHASQRNNGEELHHIGRPRELDARTVRRIKRFINRYPKATYKQVQTHLSLTCSRKTIYRELKVYGIIKWHARKRPRSCSQTPKFREKIPALDPSRLVQSYLVGRVFCGARKGEKKAMGFPYTRN